jgi:hypothetical protein
LITGDEKIMKVIKRVFSDKTYYIVKTEYKYIHVSNYCFNFFTGEKWKASDDEHKAAVKEELLLLGLEAIDINNAIECGDEIIDI